jgi:hypothetical protein
LTLTPGAYGGEQAPGEEMAMDSGLIAYGLGLLLITTVFWAAVWWWLPALFRDRDERKDRSETQAGPRRRLGDSGDGDEPATPPGKPEVRR